MTKINVGVIGAGYWGKKVVSEYNLLSKKDSLVSLHSVCDLLDDNLAICKAKQNVSHVTKYYDDVISSPEVDAVHICTPNETHYELCKAALDAKKHVLVEKPITQNFSEALKLVDLANSNNRVLSVGHIFRFNNAIDKVQSLVQNNFFGDLFWLKLEWATLTPIMTGRDIINDLAPHPFDILNYILGKWPSKITCKAKAYRNKDFEETAYIIAEFEDNLMANIELNWLSPGKVRELSIMGSKRFAKIDCLTQEVKVFEDDHFYDLPVQSNNTIGAELDYFIRCIQKGSIPKSNGSHQNNGLMGAKVVKLLEVSRQSMKEARTKTIDW
jgi:UDP-N-acetylglucosamine 3-dehydrogenase